jgi:hypothetical protein
MDTPEFFDAVAKRWNEIKDVEVAETIKYIREESVRYQSEFERNFERHKIMGEAQWSTPAVLLSIESFIGHVDYLTAWLEARAGWLDYCFNGNLEDFDPLEALLDFYAVYNRINIILDGEAHEFDVPPIMLYFRVMLTLQVVADLFDMDIDYDPETGVAVLSKDGITITHEVGSTVYEADGTIIEFDAPSIIIRELAFIPLRVILEVLGYDVIWQIETNTSLISTGDTE